MRDLEESKESTLSKNQILTLMEEKIDQVISDWEGIKLKINTPESLRIGVHGS